MLHTVQREREREFGAYNVCPDPLDPSLLCCCCPSGGADGAILLVLILFTMTTTTTTQKVTKKNIFIKVNGHVDGVTGRSSTRSK